MMELFKELLYLYNYIHYCIWDGKYEKAKYVYDNCVKPIAKKHPILDYFASII